VRAEQVTGPVTYHGEGPVWSERWGGLHWVDMLAGDVLYWWPTVLSTGTTSAASPLPFDLAARAERSSA
jgi:sugar lactone lactonase YvrE